MDYSKPRLYKDFQPETQLLKEESAEILRVKLPGFTKDRLKVQLDSIGNLKITGERPIISNQWSRFRLDFRVPENSNTSGIRAKYEGGFLDIVVPYNNKIIPPPASIGVADHSAKQSSVNPAVANQSREHDVPGKQQLETAAAVANQSREHDVPGKQQPETAAAVNNMSSSRVGDDTARKTSQPTSPTSNNNLPAAPGLSNAKKGDHGTNKDDQQHVHQYSDGNNNKNKMLMMMMKKKEEEDDSFGAMDLTPGRDDDRGIGYGIFGTTRTDGQRRLLVVNIVVATLVLVGLGMYVFFRLEIDDKRTI